MVMRDGTRYQCLVCSNSARDMYNSREHMYTHLGRGSSVLLSRTQTLEDSN